MEENCEKKNHLEELDIIYNSSDNEFTEDNSKNSQLIYYIRVYFRYFRRKYPNLFRKNKDCSFKNILYLTTSPPPLDFVSAFRKQYPDKNIKIIQPIENIDGYKNTGLNVNFFFQNKIHSASLYKTYNDKEHVEIFGLYSKTFVGKDFSEFEFLVPFMKAVRQIIKIVAPSIVHSDNLPFFLGSEFEQQFPHNIKIVQIVHDFSDFESQKIDPFWAAINLADKKNLKKLFKNKIIKKCLTSICAMPKSKENAQDVLDFVYHNFSLLKSNQNDEIKKLNTQIRKIFPQMMIEDNSSYNLIAYTIKKANCWAVISQKYHKDVLTKPEISGGIYNTLFSTKNKSTYVSYGLNNNNGKIFQEFTSENFRDYRDKNKKYLIKEFSSARIKINFITSKMFVNKDYTIRGFLDSTIEAPLIFNKFSPDIFSTGGDIGLTTLLNLLVKHNNVQIIVNIPNGLDNPHIVSWIEYLEKNKGLDGRWMFIDGELNLPQFYAASDLTLLPAKKNPCGYEHYLAMKYGCIPVATKKGIYNDTIPDIFEDITNGCGFKTQDNDELDEFNNFYTTTIKAINLYNQNQGSWNLLIKNAMNYDSSWSFKIIERYNQIYNLI